MQWRHNTTRPPCGGETAPGQRVQDISRTNQAFLKDFAPAAGLIRLVLADSTPAAKSRENGCLLSVMSARWVMSIRKFIIERDIPKVGTFEREQLRGAAAKSNGVLRQLGPDIQWVESYVADNKTFCVYLAKHEDIIHKHAEISGFPATKITEVRKMIDPTTERPD